MTTNSLLFNISPEEGSGQKKKARKKRSPEAEQPSAASPPSPAPTTYILSLEDVPCPICGCPADLVDEVFEKGEPRWLVQCGWWCLTCWTIDPIEGILDEPAEPAAAAEYVVQSGTHAGKTFAEIGVPYVRSIAAKGRRREDREAAKAWLTENSG